MRKRILSLLLCIVLCLSLMPTAVFAEGNELTELHITSTITQVTAGVLPAIDVGVTDGEHVSLSSANTGWLKKESDSRNWDAFGSNTPIAVNDGSTHYAMRVCLYTEDGYTITSATKVYYNGVEVPGAVYTTASWGAYVYIDLGTASGGSEVQTYTVTFDTNGGSEIAPYHVIYGTKINLPKPPTKAVNTFGGWYTDSECNNPFDINTPITEDITLYAKWTEKQVLTELHIVGPLTQVAVGELPVINVQVAAGEHVSLLGSSNIGWYRQKNRGSWEGFGREQEIAVNDGSTRYAMRLGVQAEDGYAITSATKVYYNGVEVSGAVNSAEDWGAIILIDLGMASDSVDPVSYTITVNGGKAGTDSTGATVITSASPADIVYIFPTTPEGKAFEGWIVNAPDTLTLSNTLPAYFYMPAGNVEVTANFSDISDPQPGTITVTYDANGGTGTMAQETYTPDSSGFVKDFTVPECGFIAPAGKEFDHWENSNGTPYQVGGTPWFAESMILKAIWKDTTIPQPSTYTVTYDANGGTGSMASETLTPDTDGYVTTYRFPECGFTAPAGKEFDHWEWAYTESPETTNPANPGNHPWLHGSITVKAIWKDATTYTVTYDANGGTGTMAQETFTPDGSGFVKNFTVPECGFTAPAGKEFDHWENSNGTPYQVGGTPWIAESMILKAIWKDSTTPQPTTYIVSFEMNGHGDQITAQTVNEGAKATKPADPTEIGYMFVGWCKDSSFATAWNFDTDTVTADTTLYALWAQNTTVYTIIAGANGEWTKGSTTGLAFTSDAPFDKFDSVKIDGTVIAAANYTAEVGSTKITLAPAYLETLSVGTHTIEIVSNDGSASTNFTVKSAEQPPVVPTNYTVTFNMNGHGTQVPAQTVEEGNKSTKPADPTESGYTFDGWYADATFSAAFDFDTAINADTTIYAKWIKETSDPGTTDPQPATYTVTFNMNGHGTQVPAQTVEEGNKATKPTDPSASGYTFDGWYADATFSAMFNFDSAITANTTVYAKWTEVKKDEPSNPANPTKPADPTSPQTGDNSHLFLWIALLLISGGALAGTAVYGKKRKYFTK